ncbi:dihydroorotate dehydrogenase-domain containing protein [Nitzschia inconspicua]|uniref:Dihydroorotate dehydrogenase (quinone), mitochondrial n=1 Tax=Nitzschia inconspicua TaxID=303405 RepID=A0A9K3Q2V4_9STRA|nr:dihydroorotate dehydrogenase-domain containing protein [Nitzschia inconspicua]
MFQQALHSLRRATAQAVVGGALVIGTLEVTTHFPSQGRSSAFYHSLADDVIVPAMRATLNPELAHKVALQMAVLAPTHRPSAKEQRLNVAVTLWDNVNFSNPIGLAAGYDKDGTAIAPLLKLGFGFCEIGSVCLRPQPGNPSPRMFRLVEDEGIINRYGFNSLGADAVEEYLQEFRKTQHPQDPNSVQWWDKIYNFLWPGSQTLVVSGLLGVNLGKNKTSETPLEDYQKLIHQLGPYADYLVINVSSPNTPGLRDLQSISYLEGLVAGCQEACQKLEHPKPLLVKLSPDLTDDELEEIGELLMRLKIDGIILTNTTTSRPPGLVSSHKTETGGLSGKPLKNRSTECIRLLYQITKGQIPIIGVGGVQTGHDAYEKLKAGATLVQVYSGMIYKGPGMVSKIRDELAELMIQNGQRNLQEEVVGMDHEHLHWERQRKLLFKRNDETTTFVIDQ